MYSIEFSRDGNRFIPVPDPALPGARPLRRFSLQAAQLEADQARTRWRTEHVRIVPPARCPQAVALEALVERLLLVAAPDLPSRAGTVKQRITNDAFYEGGSAKLGCGYGVRRVERGGADQGAHPCQVGPSMLDAV